MSNVVWITGASAGIGKALAIKFANQNHKVIGTARRLELVEEIRDATKFPSNILPRKNNVAIYSDVDKIVKEIQSEHNIHCLINNAGVTSFKPFIENSINDIDDIINTNLKGAIYTIKSVLPQMIKNNSGIIFNILSVAAVKIFANSSIYAASKAGLEAFSKVIREELRENNIRLINIYPGATATDIWPEQAFNKFSDKMMTPENLANLVYDIYSNSQFLSLEEIVVRPITGDL